MSSPPTDVADRRRLGRIIIPVVLALSIVGLGIAAYASPDHSDLKAVKSATAVFRNVKKAESAQYNRFVDVNGVACIDNPGVGAMGVHYVNQKLVGDGIIDERSPEALVYQPEANGQSELVAVEYIVVQAGRWRPTPHRRRCSGRRSTQRRPGRSVSPAFYSLRHAWVWKHNPSGTLSMWNPDVHCPAAHTWKP